jgi:competence protein ComEC
MNIYTLNVGQGQFVVITGETEAIIVDTYVPLNPTNDIIHIKSALSKILKSKELVGLIVTGYDSDHFNEVGMRIVLNKYRPNWIMYPKYFKKTSTANRCFAAIEEFEVTKKFKRVSVLLTNDTQRFYTKLATEFAFEVFSPHSSDMNSSNNCSIVCKVKERITGATYLITGDTENDRWDAIANIFKNDLKSDVLDAPHHGSKNGISDRALRLIAPKTVLISAGVDNQYGHPDVEAKRLFRDYSENYYSTNTGEGQSLRTFITSPEVKTFKFTI